MLSFCVQDDILNEIQKKLLEYYSLPNLLNANLQEIQESSRQQQLSKESSGVAGKQEEEGPKRKRKVEEDQCEPEAGTFFENGVLSHTIQMSHNIKHSDVAHFIGDKKYTFPSVEDDCLESTENSMSVLNLLDINSTCKDAERNSLSLGESILASVTKRSLGLKNITSLSKDSHGNHININGNLSKDSSATSEAEEKSEPNGNFGESLKGHNGGFTSNEQTNQIPGSADSETLWDNFDTNDFNGLSMCQDALERRHESSIHVGNDEPELPVKQVAPFTAEEWSMGHVAAPQGDLVKVLGSDSYIFADCIE